MTNRSRSPSGHIAAAKELLIQRQDTHLDSLAERLREPRVRRVIEPMLAGAALGDLPRMTASLSSISAWRGVTRRAVW